VRSLHDCSEGGLGVALAEMAFAGELGATARLDKVPYRGKLRRDDIVLFSESNTRLLAEVAPADEKEFKRLLKGIAAVRIGSVERSPELIVYGSKNDAVINARIDELKTIWQTPLRSI